MARKAHDLFDVFQLAQDADNEERKRGSRRKSSGASAAKAKKKAQVPSAHVRASAGGDGLHLNRRQLLLASSALVLLLVLSFTLGLATGRPGETQNEPALNRSASFVIRGRMPLTDPTTRNPVDTVRIRRQISRDYRIRSANVMMRSEGSDLLIEIGPWPSEKAALDYWNRSGLKLVHIHLEDPFRWAKIVPYVRRP